jgi:TAG lipase/steryl ester hydrolase/phospholipase A2/LPA acyltransferase
MPDHLLHGHRAVPASSAPLLDPIKPRRKKKHHSHAPSHVSRLVQGAGNVVLSWRDGLSESERADRRRVEERKQILAARMQHVSNSAEPLSWRVGR